LLGGISLGIFVGWYFIRYLCQVVFH